MVNREVVLQTIKRMYSSGVDDETVRETLSDIGMGKAEAEELMREAKSTPAAADRPAPSGQQEPYEPYEPTLEEVQEMIAEKAAQKIKEHLEGRRAEEVLNETASGLEREEHAEMLGELGRKVEELNRKIDRPQPTVVVSESSAELKQLMKKMDAVEEEIAQLKAASSANQSLLKKILEANRKIISDIGSK